MGAIRALCWCLMLAVVMTGCRSKGEKGTPEPQLDPNTPVPVEVENHYQGDVVIYLVQGSHRERLGMVTALSSATFQFPWGRLQISGVNRLLAYPIAGARAFASEPIYLQPGQSIKWTLESDLDRSSLAVY